MNKLKMISLMLPLIFLSLLNIGQKSVFKNSDQDIPSVYKKIYGASSITREGDFLLIKSTGVPDHQSAYYSPSDSLYQSFSGTTFNGNKFQKNPNRISKMNYTFKIPLNPKMSTSHRPTPLGPIGIAINGVPFFNQYAGPNRPLSVEMNSFDQYWGHPARQGDYHYHIEPLYLTTIRGTKSSLLGFLLDGFPVYGPIEKNEAVTEKMLDEFHGHFTTTEDYPKGIYHYHITDKDPYINGSGFYGDSGTVTR